jgi:hypothetical protein
MESISSEEARKRIFDFMVERQEGLTQEQLFRVGADLKQSKEHVGAIVTSLLQIVK